MQEETSLTGFRLHEYRGGQSGEYGLMVIGSASQLQSLATAISQVAADKPERHEGDWPPSLCAIRGRSRGREFDVSFHLETVSAALPAERFKPVTPVVRDVFILGFTVLAGLGAVTLVRWLVGLGILTAVRWLASVF